MPRLFDSIPGTLLFLGSMLCMAGAGLVGFRMLFMVNDRLPPDKQIDIGPFQNYKWGRVYKEYSRLYPEGVLHWIEAALVIIGAFLLIWAVTF